MNQQLSFGQKIILPFIILIILFTGYLIFKNNPEIMNTDSFLSVLSDTSDDNDVIVRSKLFEKSAEHTSAVSSSSTASTGKGEHAQRVNHDFISDENFHQAALGDEKGEWQFLGDAIISHSAHTVRVLSAAGELKWSFSTPTPTTFVRGDWPVYGSNATPLVAGRRTLIATTEQGPIYALDLATGEVVWHARSENKYFLAPFIFHDNLMLPTELPGGQKWALTPMNLKTLETREPIGPYELPLAGQPLKSEGLYIFATQTGHLQAVDLETEKLKWAAVGSSGFRNSPGELGDRIYVGNEDGLVIVFDRKNGKKLSEFELGATLQMPVKVKESAGMGSAIDTTGNLVTFDAKSTKKLWRYNLGSAASNMPHELMQLTYGSLHKLNFNSELRGWTIWAPCQATHICIFDLKKGQLLHRIDLQGQLASRFAFLGDSLWFDVKEKDGFWLKKYVPRPPKDAAAKAAAATNSTTATGSGDAPASSDPEKKP